MSNLRQEAYLKERKRFQKQHCLLWLVFPSALDVTNLEVLMLVNKILWVEVSPLSPGNMHIYLSVNIPLLKPGVSFLEISVVRITMPRVLLTLFRICLNVLETNRSEFDDGIMIAFLWERHYWNQWDSLLYDANYCTIWPYLWQSQKDVRLSKKENSYNFFRYEMNWNDVT